jgi:carbon monoxide dehydrogenase subunit G
MKKIEETRIYNVEPKRIWEIIGDISRCDWVPGVESIELNGNERTFKMSGMGRLVERIIECNDSEMELTYSAIETMAPINHHLAKIKLSSQGKETVFTWSTEIDPPEFADAIRGGMVASLDQLQELI